VQCILAQKRSTLTVSGFSLQENRQPGVFNGFRSFNNAWLHSGLENVTMHHLQRTAASFMTVKTL
jgi:hypothetical protein